MWLSVWSEVQTYIWPSWCHCHSLSLASVKSRLVLPFWYRLTWVVSETRAVKCVCVCVHGTEWDMENWKYDNPQLECDIFNRGSSYFHVPSTTVCHMLLSYGQLQESWIISGLQRRNVNEYRLPTKNAHNPNYCSWLAVCVNYSANFYCKIALITRFKLHLIKTYSKMPNKT